MKSSKKFSIYDICEIGILVALALVLDKLKISVGATGGSINLSGVPLVLIGCRRGFVKGLIGSSIIYGFLSCLLDGYGIQYFVFDYLIAFSGYSLVGLFYYHCFKQIKSDTKRLIYSLIFGIVGAFFTRLVGHTISSIIFYNYSFIPAIIYNVVYVGFSIVGTLIICILIAKPIIVINDKFADKNF